MRRDPARASDVSATKRVVQTCRPGRPRAGDRPRTVKLGLCGLRCARRRMLRFTAVIEARAVEALRPVTLPALRVGLGVLFVWFGALKVSGTSPVESIVAGTLPWADREVVVPLLGGLEVLLGVGVIAAVRLRLLLTALVAHLAGTFLAFVMLPEMMFRQHNPLLLTTGGEFVAKNLVLIAGTLVLICAHAPNPAASAQDLHDQGRADHDNRYDGHQDDRQGRRQDGHRAHATRRS